MDKTPLWHRFQAERLRESAAEWDKAAHVEGLFHLKTAFKTLAQRERELAAQHDHTAVALRVRQRKTA